MRIISLLPSATEIICLLELQNSLVGITHGCDFPADISHLPVVTKTTIDHHAASSEIDRQVRKALTHSHALYTLEEELIRALKPDLLVTQSLCNVCAVDQAQAAAIAQTLPGPAQVINLEPASLQDLFATIQRVAAVTGTEHIAEKKLAAMKARIENVQQRTALHLNSARRTRVVFLEWIDPLFNCGHWIPELIDIAGGIDCLGQSGAAAKTIAWQDIVRVNPDVLIVCCCGYTLPQAGKDIAILKAQAGWENLRCVQTGQVFMVDGNAYFSRPSPRLIDSLEILQHMLHWHHSQPHDPRCQLIC